MPPSRPSVLVLGTALLLGSVLAGCGKDTSAGKDAIALEASDSACTLAKTDLQAGHVTFAIKNTGSKVTEVYVYEGDRIVTEKENIGPGTSYNLTVTLKAGTYDVACKPGQTGDGIRQKITVTGSGSAGAAAADPEEAKAVAQYRSWVQQQADALVPVVDEFVAAVKAGDVAKAKSLYATSTWSRVRSGPAGTASRSPCGRRTARRAWRPSPTDWPPTCASCRPRSRRPT
jgi:iron uptake system component EfeO